MMMLFKRSGFKWLSALTAGAVLSVLVACGNGSNSSASNGPPDTGNTYTSLATPLLDYIAADRAVNTTKSSSLNTSIVYGGDFFSDTPSILTANYGFEGYMGVQGLNGTGAAAQAAAYAGNVSYESLDPNLQAPSRAYYSAVGELGFAYTYEVFANAADTIPVVFSHPIWPPSVTPAAFAVTMNTGAVVTPLAASFLPNSEYNERQTVVITGYWGNRIQPGNPGAEYPVSVSIVSSPTELTFVTPRGLKSAVGLSVESKNPYVSGNGPRILAAKLNVFSDLGESNPSGFKRLTPTVALICLALLRNIACVCIPARGFHRTASAAFCPQTLLSSSY